MRNKYPGWIGLALCCTLLAACGIDQGGVAQPAPEPGNGPQPTPSQLLALKPPATCSAFDDYVADSVADYFLNVGIVRCPGCPVILAADQPAAAAAGTDSLSFDAFTETNGQEAGVDEIDAIETDAQGIFYMIDGRRLVVAEGLPPDALREIASLELSPDGFVEGLLLDRDNARLVAAVTDYNFASPALFSILPPAHPVVELLFIDVADPANPVIDRRLRAGGYHLAGRRIDDRVHVVIHATPRIPDAIITDPELVALQAAHAAARNAGNDMSADAAARDIRRRVDTLVAAGDARDFLPPFTVQAGAAAPVDARLPDCTDIAIPDVTMPWSLTSIISVDSDGTDASSLTVPNNAWNVYASEANIYLSQTSAGWWFAERQKQQTAIYKFGIGSGAPTYRALGLVDGWVGSSFQFSEHDGYLRVATGVAEIVGNALQRSNHLFVLADNGLGSLVPTGSVRDFGRDETIFSARFLGDRGFVVTFRQIDPLFAFDLSDPFNPRLAGELEIPGVSTYIHPLDDRYLLTIGFDGDETRLNGDFALQIFDVQNLNDPRLVHRFVPEFDAAGFAWTQATHDHLAFNYFPEAGTLTVPVQYHATALDDHFSGFIAFSVSTATGFAELGRLDHSPLARSAYCAPPGGSVPAICADGRYLESALPRRSVSALFGGDVYIYTLSNVAMLVSRAADFERPVGTLPLPYPNIYIW